MRGWLAFWLLIYGVMMFVGGYAVANPTKPGGEDEKRSLVLCPLIIALMIAGLVLGSSRSW